MGVQMYVSLSGGTWRANGNSNPCTWLVKILQAYPHLPKEGFSASLTPHSPPRLRETETL